VAGTLGSCPASEDAALILSELMTNSIIHSASGGSGGSVSVAVNHRAGGILLAVTDQGGPWVADAREDDLSGHGLVIVGSLAHAWGVAGDDSGRTVWAELACPAATSPDSAVALSHA
jgi:two-component sensor histidine kinase